MPPLDVFAENAHRVRLFFDTPNELAVALVMAWGALVYLFSTERKNPNIAIVSSPRSWLARTVCHLVTVALLVVCLAATYSRSGMVAFAAVGGLLWREKETRKWLAVSLAVWLLCLMLLPGTAGRFTQIEPFADKSISNRFDVWRGTLAMSLGSPWTGFGISRFGEMLTTWHLPVNGSDAIYMTAVNTPLTVLGFFGYPALFAYLCAWMLLLTAGLRDFRNGKKGSAVCFIIQTSFLMGGFFADLHQSWILDAVLLASIAGTIVFHLHDAPSWKPFYKRWGATFAIVSAVTCSLLAGAGSILFSEGYALRGVSLDTYGESAGQGWALIPKRANGNRLVWVVSHDKVREHARSLCCPLAMRGWTVFMLEPGAGEMLNTDAGAAFLRDKTALLKNALTCVLGGLGEDGLAALSLASKLPQSEGSIYKTVVVNIDSHWPFVELNPQNTIKTVSGPLILVHGSDGIRYSRSANTLAETGRKAGKQADVLPLDASGEKDLLVLLRSELLEARR